MNNRADSLLKFKTMDYLQKIITDIELHSVEGIRQCFDNGISPNQLYKGAPLIEELISEYTRTSRFKDCVKVFVDCGLQFENKALLAVLLDDSLTLGHLLADDPELGTQRHTLKCAYTPLEKVTLLHICAEFNHLACVKVLIKYGADPNAKAGTDAYQFGGQTPIFHTVNQHHHFAIDTMKFLIAQGADLNFTVKGLVWGRGYEWETFIPAVNPISYAMMGFLRQFQRTEKDTYEVVQLLLTARYGIDYQPLNIPNQYLNR
jgi:hypothetical protein